MGVNKGIRGAASLIHGFNMGWDAVGKIGRDIETANVAREKPTTDMGYTAAQGEELRAAADSGQYDIAYDQEKGHYTVRPKASPEMVGEIAPQQRTQFLGKTYDKPLDDYGVSRERRLAMAGVAERWGDVAGGGRMRDDIRRADFETERLAAERTRGQREAELFPLQLGAAKRADARETRLDQKTAQSDATEAQMSQAWNTRLTGPDGKRRPATVDDHLWLTEQRAYAMADSGDTKAASEAYQQFASQAMIKIQMETAQRTEAVTKAMAGLNSGDFRGVADVYNRFLPDGATVTNIKPGPKGTVIIEREMGGKPAKPHTMSLDELRVGLQSASDPGKAWQMSQQMFQNNMAMRADARAGAAAGRAVSEFEAGAGGRQVAQQTAALQLERLSPNTTPERRAQIDELLAGGRKADTNEPADVKLAKYAVSVGMFADPKEALSWAARNKDASPEKVRADLYSKALASSGSSEAAKKATNEGMAYLFPGGDGPKAAPKAGPKKGDVIDGFEYLGGDPNNQASWKKK